MDRKDLNRTEQIAVRLRSGERKLLDLACSTRGVRLSEFVRQVTLTAAREIVSEGTAADRPDPAA